MNISRLEQIQKEPESATADEVKELATEVFGALDIASTISESIAPLGRDLLGFNGVQMVQKAKKLWERFYPRQ